LDGRYTKNDRYDWVFDVEATATGDKDHPSVTGTSKLYFKSTAESLFMFYSVPLELKDMTWTEKDETCCTHDSWGDGVTVDEQDQKDVVHSEYFQFEVGGNDVGMAQDRDGGGEETGSPFVAGKTTYEWLRLKDVEGTYTGGSSTDKDVSSPVLTQTAGIDTYEVAPGQQGGDTNDPADYWVFEMGYEFELLRSALPAYDPDVASSILALVSNFEYHLSPYKNGINSTLLTPCIDTNTCPVALVNNVPLPASAWLLLGGFGALGAWRRLAG
jgi:hypothetical protein